MKGILLTAVSAVLCLLLFLPLPARAAEGEYTVFVSVEGFTLGHGFYVVPTAVRVRAGATVWDAAVALLEGQGLAFDVAPWGGLERIHGVHPNGGSVGMFDYSEEAGWLFTVNHFMPDVGAEELPVADGDVIRWQFSVTGWGADLGLGEAQGFWMEPPIFHADETDVIRLLFEQELEDALLTAMLDSIVAAWAREVSLADWVNPFADVGAGDWFFRYMQLVNYHGIMIGVPGGMFRPDSNVTMAQAVTMLWRLHGEPVYPTDDARWFGTALAWSWFQEVDMTRRISAYEFAGLLGLPEEGVRTFSHAPITRAQAAEIIAVYFLRAGVRRV